MHVLVGGRKITPYWYHGGGRGVLGTSGLDYENDDG